MTLVCTECVGDVVLAARITEQGELRECTFGHGARQTIELEALADIVDPVYRRYHEEGGWVLVPLPEEIGDHNHQQLGDGPELLLGEMLESEPDVVDVEMDDIDGLPFPPHGSPFGRGATMPPHRRYYITMNVNRSVVLNYRASGLLGHLSRATLRIDEGP